MNENIIIKDYCLQYSIFSGITLLGLAPVTGIIITSIFGGYNAIYLFLTEDISIGLKSKKFIEKFVNN